MPSLIPNAGVVLVGGSVLEPNDSTIVGQMRLWLRGDDIGDFFQDSTRLIAVNSDGDPIGSWTDDSGQNNHASQAVAGKRWTYKTDVIGTRDGALADGVDDSLENAWAPTNTHTIYVVLRRPAAAVASIVFARRSTTATNPIQTTLSFGITTDAPYVAARDDAGNLALFDSASVSTGNQILVAKRNGNAVYLYRNGVLLGSATAALGTTTTDKTLIGAQVSGGITEANFLSGHIFELIGYDAAHADTQVLAVSHWLNNKFGGIY